MAESEEEVKTILMKVKEESEKSWLKTQHSKNKNYGIQSHNLMANRWGDSDRLHFLGLQITSDCNCSQEIKRHLLLGRKAVTILDGILKIRDVTLPTKVCMVFPVIMYGCENWNTKKAKHLEIDAFDLWCCRRLLESLGHQGEPTSQS